MNHLALNRSIFTIVRVKPFKEKVFKALNKAPVICTFVNMLTEHIVK